MDNRRFTIFRASAGSGKTYTLVREYILLAFSAGERHLDTRFGRILAITFTNKAVNEMKERILRELDHIAEQGTGSNMGNDIAQTMRLDDATLRHYAATVRTAILHNYSDFAVCTIDSFMHRLVRSFAHDLDLPLTFDVHIDTAAIIQNAVDDLMALVGTDGQEELATVMCEFAENRMSDGKSFMVENDLATLAAELFKEQTPEYLKDLSHLDMPRFCQINKEMRDTNRDYELQLKTLAKEALKHIYDAGVQLNDFYYGQKGAGHYFRRLAAGEMIEPNTYVLAYLDGDKYGASGCDKKTLAALEDIKPKLQQIYRQINILHDTEAPRYNTRRLLLKNLYSLALINKLNELVDIYSKENEIVHIAEFNKRIAAVVQEEPTPFIYERIGNRYYNYLIDEFQDTSRMQWQNLVPLVENGVASGHASLVVGDGKQAIYRFRQGDVEQFASLPRIDNRIHGRLLEHPETSHVCRLERNFRSADTVVNFNNDFFEWIVRNRFSDNAQMQQIYLGDGDSADLRQNPVKKGGYVQVGFWEKDLGEDILWKEMLDDIHTMTRDKGYELRDITVLARDNRTLSKVSTFLTENGIPVVSGESFLLTQSHMVMLMRSLLQYLVDSSDRTAAMQVLQHLYRLGRISSLHEEAFSETPDAVDLDAILKYEGLELNCTLLRQMSLYDCCEEILRNLHLDNIETAYTATWLNVAAKYAGNHRQDLSEFLEWFNQQKDRLSTSTADDLNAVQLMTIHKAKGLEKPIVLYPIPTTRDKQNSIWVHIPQEYGLPLPASLVHLSKREHTLFDDECQEELRKSDMDRINILYVALTRPKDKLLIYAQAKNSSENTDYGSLLRDYLASRNDLKEVRPNVVALGSNDSNVTASHQAENRNEIRNAALTTTSFPNWSGRIAIAEQSKHIFEQLDEKNIEWGNLVHRLLSLINSIDDTDSVLQDFLTRNPLPDDKSAQIEQLLRNMLKQPDIARFFRPESHCKNERDIAWDGKVLRPDRIVFSPEETSVIDFKSGTPKNEHHAQVLHYCDALRAMGYANVKGYLLYLGTDHSQLRPCE